MVFDGAARQHALGFAAVLVDAAGIAAYFWCQARVWDSSSWLAEWLGKLLAVEQAIEAGALQCLLLGDNLSAAINDMKGGWTVPPIPCAVHIAGAAAGKGWENPIPHAATDTAASVRETTRGQTVQIWLLA